jgi:hypothetical protein
LVVDGQARRVVGGPSNSGHVAKTGPHVANYVDFIATRGDLQAAWEPGDEGVIVPARTHDGRITYVEVSRRLFLQGVGTTAAAALLSPGKAGNPTWPDDPWDFAATMSRRPGVRLSRADPAYGADWSMALPGGRSMLGSRLDVQVYPTQKVSGGRVLAAIADRRRAHDFVRRPSRGLLAVAQQREGETRLYALDTRRAASQLAGGVDELQVPEAYELDDLTYGILWATANLDDALQADDQGLSEARNDLSAYERLSASAVSREAAPHLNGVAHMWLGSDFCARHILKTLPELPEVPAFWTREQAGEEASTWLLFEHKFTYLQQTTNLLGTASIRAFCIPEQAVKTSPRYERVLLFLAVALMESVGIQTQITPDPAYSTVEGFVVAPNRQAIIANWVRGDGMWHVDTTSRTATVRECTQVAADVIAHSATQALAAQMRLRTFADYLDLDWVWLRNRCAALAQHGTSGFIHARSRLVSAAGLDTACAFVGSFLATS